jgi:GTP-binding protein
MINGRRIKLRYAHAGGHNPPIVVIHGNQTSAVPKHYQRYLEKTFRRVLDLHGTPLRIEFKTSDNPYEGRGKPKTTSRRSSDSQRNKRGKAAGNRSNRS